MSGRYWTPLLSVAFDCGLCLSNTLHVVDKAILLLNRKADVLCCDDSGDTVLHIILNGKRLHEEKSYKRAKAYGMRSRWLLSRKQPLDLLMVFITAGADVYAVNTYGKTPSRVAHINRRTEEWIEALQLCGYDYEEILAHPSLCTDCCKENHQTSKLSFEEYCQQRESSGYDGFDSRDMNGCISSGEEKSDDEEEDDDEEESDGEEEGPNCEDKVMKGDGAMIEAIPETIHCDGRDLTTFRGIESNMRGITLLLYITVLIY
jgi:hypothetical protein